MSLTSVDFPEPDTPVTAVRTPSGNETSMSRRLFSFAPCTVKPARGVRGTPDVGQRDRLLARQVLPGHRLLVGEELLQRPAVDDLSAVLTGAGADVDHPVRHLDGVLVVLDDDQGVTHVAEAHEGLDQAVVVALVQTDRRLVQDVQDADQTGADLGGEADALGLAAGERRRPRG